MQWELVPAVYLYTLWLIQAAEKVHIITSFMKICYQFSSHHMTHICWLLNCRSIWRQGALFLFKTLSLNTSCTSFHWGSLKIWCSCSDAFGPTIKTLAVTPLLFLKAPANLAFGSISEYDYIVVLVDSHYSFVPFQYTACLQLRVWFWFSLPHMSVASLKGPFYNCNNNSQQNQWHFH